MGVPIGPGSMGTGPIMGGGTPPPAPNIRGQQGPMSQAGPGNVTPTDLLVSMIQKSTDDFSRMAPLVRQANPSALAILEKLAAGLGQLLSEIQPQQKPAMPPAPAPGPNQPPPPISGSAAPSGEFVPGMAA